MAIDQNKIKKAAQKAVDRGQYDKAIHLLQKLIGRNTRDTRTLLKIGDLQRRKGDDRDAAKTLREVGEIYTEQGFFLKAVAVYKQVLKLTPNDIDVKLRLAEMYERLELVTEALATYEETVTLYARDGNVVKVLEGRGARNLALVRLDHPAAHRRWTAARMAARLDFVGAVGRG